MRDATPFSALLSALRRRFPPRGMRTWLLLAGALAGAAWCSGAVLFLAADGSLSCSLPRRAPPPLGEHNLASYRWGPTVRASSYFRDPVNHHHPLFLVDEQPRPRRVEKWASAARDTQPWIEILWREPRLLARVVIQHARSRERAELSARAYRLSCLTERGEAAQLSISDNRAAVAVHSLRCQGARGLRIVWQPNRPDALTRVYEVEAWGR